jgi:hypothetical protein
MSIKIPSKIIAGDTFLVTGSLSDYSPATYTLYLTMTGSSDTIDIEGTTYLSGFKLYAAPATTTDWTPGTYNYSLYVSDGTDEYTVQGGQTVIVLRTDLQDPEDKRTHAQKIVDAIESVLEGKATKDVSSYNIAGRSITKIPFSELIELRKYYKNEVLRNKKKPVRRIDYYL